MSVITTPSFPDLAVRLHQPNDPNESLTFELNTFDPDNDDEGDAHDYGHAVIEGGTIVGDGTKKGYDIGRIRQLASLLEHAPDLYTLLTAYVNGRITPGQQQAAARVLDDIALGELMYRDQ